MTTLIVCIKRRPDLSHEEFAARWRAHGPILLACSDFNRHLTGYVQHYPVNRETPVAAQFGITGDYDGVAVLSFRNLEAMRQAFAEPRYLAEVAPNEPGFVDVPNCLSFLTEPNTIKAPASDMFSVVGKTAVVTGGARGVGGMISRALVEAGADVLIVARGNAENKKFAQGLGSNAALLAHDLSTITGVRAAAAAIEQRTKELHILVNNAGTFTAAPVDALEPEQWDREFAINIRAPFFLAQSLLRLLKKAARDGDPARIINIGSIAALWAKSSMAYAYSATKGGVHQLTRALASDLTRQGITVNAIAPGFFPSDMTAEFFEAVPGLEEQMIEGIPAHRLGTAEDIGGTVIFLASRAGAYLSGAVLPVEGGLWSA